MSECRYGHNRVFWVRFLLNMWKYVEYLTKVEGGLTSS